MFGRAIALVLSKTVLGKRAVYLTHDPVTRDLGENGRGRDREREGVAVNDALLRDVNVVQDEGVEQQRVRGNGQHVERAIHCQVRCAQNVELVYFFSGRRTNPVRARDLANGLKELFTRSLIQELGIVCPRNGLK